MSERKGAQWHNKFTEIVTGHVTWHEWLYSDHCMSDDSRAFLAEKFKLNLII